MEIIQYGTVAVKNRNLSLISWPKCEGCLVFLKSDNQAFMQKSAPRTDVNSQMSHTYITADRDDNIRYLIAGFRMSGFDVDPGGYGIRVKDAQGRIGFHSGRRYVRLPYPPLQLISGWPGGPSGGVSPSIGSSMFIDEFYTAPALRHPYFTGNTYFCWGTMPCWHNSGSVNWYLCFQQYNMNTIQTLRVDMQDSYVGDPNINMGYYVNTPPGNGVLPGVLLTTEFVTPP